MAAPGKAKWRETLESRLEKLIGCAAVPGTFQVIVMHPAEDGPGWVYSGHYVARGGLPVQFELTTEAVDEDGDAMWDDEGADVRPIRRVKDEPEP